MTIWNYINIVLCLLLLAFLCWNELRRTNRSRLALRLVASVLSVAALVFLILPLNRRVKENPVRGGEAVLLTEGFSEDSVNNFLKKKKDLPVFVVEKKFSGADKKYKPRFIGIAEISELRRRGDLIHIFGHGLDREDLLLLNGNSMVFHPSKLKDGIASVSWQHSIKSGDQLKVQGSFNNSKASEIKLIFSGDGASLDTAIIPANKSSDFELTAVPKQVGKAVYALSALSGKDTVEKEQVPFETTVPGNLRVFVLAASPDFENKFLKTWLTGNNSSLVSRTQISKDKYEKTFLNTDLTTIGAITGPFLNNFDLLVADAGALAAISKAELGAIETQIAQKGMGLIVKADSASSKSSFFSRPFPVRQHADNYKKELSIYIPPTNGYAAALVSEHPLYIQREPGTRTLIEDKESNTVVSGTIYGSGRIIYTTLNSTFSWMLSGDIKNYAAYWSYLLEEATARTGVEGSWKVSPAFPVANKPAEIHYAANSGEIPNVQVGGEFVHLAQDPDLPFQWTGVFWPKQTGWQPIMQEGKASSWWYAYGPGDWGSITAAEKIRATAEGIQTLAQQRLGDAAAPNMVTVPVNKIYFFILFLLCAGFLWIERKL